MIISFRHRFIFIAIPKTATHAFRTALRPHLGPQDWEQCVLLEKKFFPVEAFARIGHGHITCQQIQPFLLPGFWENSLSFCTVRNPYERFVSYCYFINRENRMMQDDPLSTMKRIINDPHSREHILFRPQHEFVTDDEGRLMAHNVCKFESLQQDFNQVCDHLNLPQTLLQRVNVTTTPPEQRVFDLELKELVQAVYRRDFELFGYSFELPSSLSNSISKSHFG